MALSDARHKFLLEQLARVGRIGVADMAAQMQVSHETIRRDLRLLERSGHLRCVYGGAVVQPRDSLQDQPIIDRMRLHRQEKAQIGRLAASLVKSGESIFLDTGTTTLALAGALAGALAQQLMHLQDLRVTTNSLDIARMLAGAGMEHVCVTGGDVRCSDNALVGHATVAAVRGHLFDMAFMGIAAIDIEHGFMDYGAEESVLRQTLLAHARRCVMLADSSKFGRTARLRTFGLGEVGLLVSDIRPPPAFAKRFGECNVEVMHG